jgi:hypothetical protein
MKITYRQAPYACTLIGLAVAILGMFHSEIAFAQEDDLAPLSPVSGTVALSGRVLGPGGKPAAGVAVGIISQWAGIPGLGEIFKVTTDDAGVFHLLAVKPYGAPRYAFGIWARDDRHKLMGATFAKLPAPEQGITLSTEQLIEVHLAPAAYIHTGAFDANGQPLRNMMAQLFLTEGGLGGLMNAGQIDPTGNILVGPLPAGIGLRLQSPPELWPLALNDAWTTGLKGDIRLSPGQTYELPALRVDMDGRKASGLVQDEQGLPVAGAQVTCNVPTLCANAVTDGKGRFTITRLPIKGDIWLIASHPSELLHVMQKVDPNAGDAMLVVHPLTSAKGQFVDDKGRPVKRANVQAAPCIRSANGWMIWQAPSVRMVGVLTDDDGFFEVKNIVVGAPYMLVLQIPGVAAIGPGGTDFTAKPGKPIDFGALTATGAR